MVVTLVLMRFLSRQVNIRVAFWTVLALTAAPLSAVGAILMTVDPLLVTFWTVAMVTGWQALQTGSTKSWLWTGFFLGLGCLSKYTALAQVACFACFFALHKPSRPQLRRAGPWLALVIILVMQTPVLVWNAQHGWSTVHHVAEDAGVGNAWTPTLKYFFEFMAVEAGLLNPVFFIATIWACIAMWRRTQDVLIRYLFCMGAPLFLGYLLYSFKIRILPNWIAASVVPLFCVMVIYWERRWREGVKAVGTWLRVGLILGFVAVVLTHETRLIGRLTGKELPAGDDPLMRSRGWKETAAAVETEYLRLLREGKPVFVIGSHYGITGELSLYMEEGRRTVASDQPLVYYLSSDKPHNQFYFWPGYRSRKGQNAIYVERIKTTGPIAPVSEQLLREFAEVKDLGTREIFWKGRLARRIRMIECRSLK
jgi:4-amino-4-deoxy-L-arabinose transferase-like glycosyltransferase